VNRTIPSRIPAGRLGAIGVGLLASAMLLVGCGGSDADTDAGAAAASAQAAAQAAAQASAQAVASAVASAVGVAPVGTEGGVATGGSVSAAEFCAQLKKTQPKLDQVGSAVGAMALLTGDLASLYSAKGAMTEMDGTQMDQMVAEACPDAGAAALKSAGLTSFSAL
jgi:hypothetical protein